MDNDRIKVKAVGIPLPVSEAPQSIEQNVGVRAQDSVSHIRERTSHLEEQDGVPAFTASGLCAIDERCDLLMTRSQPV